MFIDAVSDYFERFKIVDIGPQLAADGPRPTLLSLAQHPKVDYIGIDADADLIAQLGHEHRDYGLAFICHTLGDGQTHKFFRSEAGNLSSLYPLDDGALGRVTFSDHEKAFTVVEDRETVRLDDIPEAKDADILRLSIEGAEVEVLANSTKVLPEVILAEIEVSLFPVRTVGETLSKVMPIMADHGFLVHKLEPICRYNFKPWINPPGMSQDMTARVVFIKDYRTAIELTVPKLIAAGVTLQHLYDSFDVANYYTHQCDHINGTDADMFYIHSDNNW